MSDTATESYISEAFESSQGEAVAAGCEVIHSTDTTLLLDFDTGAQQDHYRLMLPRAQRAFPGIKETARWNSKSGRGVHVVLSLPKPMSVAERLLLQCALGSDPVREILGLALLHDGVENPIMLFRPRAK